MTTVFEKYLNELRRNVDIVYQGTADTERRREGEKDRKKQRQADRQIERERDRNAYALN